jgi:hypothetical protein
MSIKSLTPIAVAAVVLAASAQAAVARQDSLSVARAGTAAFHDLGAATAAGYAEFHDADDIACIDNPAGGMGVHFVDLGAVLDPSINAGAPEALVYAPKADGGMRLVAVEYIVFQDAWDAGHASPPSLFGEDFEAIGSENRYGIPPFYELHAWIWKTNPRGMFDDWNPRVSCDVATANAALAQRAAAERTWTPENLDRLANAYSALNPGWTRP